MVISRDCCGEKCADGDWAGTRRNTVTGNLDTRPPIDPHGQEQHIIGEGGNLAEICTLPTSN